MFQRWGGESLEVGNTVGRDINRGCIRAMKSKNTPTYPQVQWYGKDRENSQPALLSTTAHSRKSDHS